MRGGFREWEVGDNVLVEYLSRAQRRAATCSSTVDTSSITDIGSLAGGSLVWGASSSGGAASATDEGVGGDVHLQQTQNNDGGSAQSSAGNFSAPKLMPAVITDNSAGGGLFDIRWSDGERERGVRRNRIHRPTSPCPPWTIIYQGTDCHYAVQGVVPESIVERERDFPYEVRGASSATNGHDSKRIVCMRSAYRFRISWQPIRRYNNRLNSFGAGIRQLLAADEGDGGAAGQAEQAQSGCHLADQLWRAGAATRCKMPGEERVGGGGERESPASHREGA